MSSEALWADKCGKIILADLSYTAFSILVFSCPSMGRKNNSAVACGFGLCVQDVGIGADL